MKTRKKQQFHELVSFEIFSYCAFFFSAKEVMSLPVCVPWLVGWFVSRISQKLLNGFL